MERPGEKRRKTPSCDRSRERPKVKSSRKLQPQPQPLQTKPHDQKQSQSQKKRRIRQVTEQIYNQYFLRPDQKQLANKKKKSKPESKRPAKHTDYFPPNNQYLLDRPPRQHYIEETDPLETSRTNESRHEAPGKPENRQVQNVMSKLINVPINVKQLSQSQLMTNTHQTMAESDTFMETSCNEENNQSMQSNGNDSTNNHSGHFLESPKELECCQPYYTNNGVDLSTMESEQADFIRRQLPEVKQLDPRVIRSQKDITMRMRSQTLDWMFSLSEQIELKRDTMHLAVLFLDTYLTMKQVLKTELQLVAIASIILAFKFEQKAPMNFIMVFESNGPRGYNRARILDMEKKLALELKYRFHKTTLMNWMHILTYEWDRFICQARLVSLTIIQQNMMLVTSNLRLRSGDCLSQMTVNFLQLLDAAVFSPDIYAFEKGKIVLSALYLILRIEVQSLISNDQHCYRNYYDKFRKNMNPIYTDKHGFNELFIQFLAAYNVELAQLNPTNKFMAQFLDLDFSKTSDPLQVSPEDYLHSQTYNSTMLFYVNTKL